MTDVPLYYPKELCISVKCLKAAVFQPSKLTLTTVNLENLSTIMCPYYHSFFKCKIDNIVIVLCFSISWLCKLYLQTPAWVERWSKRRLLSTWCFSGKVLSLLCLLWCKLKGVGLYIKKNTSGWGQNIRKILKWRHKKMSEINCKIKLVFSTQMMGSLKYRTPGTSSKSFHPLRKSANTHFLIH